MFVSSLVLSRVREDPDRSRGLRGGERDDALRLRAEAAGRGEGHRHLLGLRLGEHLPPVGLGLGDVPDAGVSLLSDGVELGQLGAAVALLLLNLHSLAGLQLIIE